MSGNSSVQRFAGGEWLTRPLMIFTAGLMAAGTIAAILFLFITGTGTLDFAGRPLGTDFSSFFAAGRMVLEGRAAEAYDWVQHFEMQRRIHGSEQQFPWSYPPIFLLVASLFALLPYIPSFLAWQGASLLAAAVAYSKIIRGPLALLVGFGFPATLICLGHGQTGFLTAALMVGGLLAIRRSELLAGVLFGLLAYKPQFGVLLPFVLAAGGYWRAFFAAAATVLGLLGITLALWGWPVWEAFLVSTSATRVIVFEAGDTGFEKFQSAFAWVRLWGGSVLLAYAMQALVASYVLVVCIWMWRTASIPFRIKAAALLVGSLLISPYTLDYDFVVLGMALAFIVAEGMEHGFRPWEKTVLALAWFAPLLARSMAKLSFLPIGFFMLSIVFLLIADRAREARRSRKNVAPEQLALT